jgi:tRNA pseudouridine13 synthase
MGAISYKVKVKPEDFRVVEIADLKPTGKGRYRLYKLRKSNWNTTDLLMRLAKRFQLPYGAFSYGGRKDRHALTEQYITIEDQRDLSLAGDSYCLESLGFASEPMRPELVRGNHFHITLRALKAEELPTLERNLRAVKEQGLPNYFDDQRFGSYDRERGFAAEKMLKGDWEEALLIYLTLKYPQEKRQAKLRKQFFRENWWKWDACLRRARTAAERRIFRFLKEHGADYAAAVNLIPREELSMMLAAYQSFLWNQMVAELISHLAPGASRIAGRAGDYLFYAALGSDAFDYLRALKLPTPGPRVEFPDQYAEHVYETILSRAGLMPSDFALKKLKRAYFNSFKRDVILVPEALELVQVEPDDLYPGRSKATITFTLPRGSYGTMVLKRLTLD